MFRIIVIYKINYTKDAASLARQGFIAVQHRGPGN